MMANWRETTLGEVCDEVNGIIQTGPFGSQLHQSDYSSVGIPVVMPKDIIEGRIDPESVARVSLEHVERLSRHKLRSGDIVYGRRGDIGRQALIRPEQEGWMCGTGCLRISLGDSVINPLFLHRYLQQDDVVGWITNQAVGATMPNLNTGILRSVPVRFPPLPIQQRIAGILSAYDGLIENSQRRIKILETMARDLYREWFVNFRFSGHENHRRVTSPLGDIPEGWECLQLASLIKVLHGYAFKGEYFSDEPTSRVLTTPGNFKIGGGIKYDRLKFYREDGPVEPGYVFEPMDLMLTMTDLSKTGDTLGFPAFIPKLGGLTFLHNQRVGRVVPLGQFFPKHLLYCLFCDERYRHHIVGGATGMSVKHTSPGRILSYAFALPKESKLIDVFEDFARPVFQQMNVLIEEVQNLRRTRDLLLPRLLSGQINMEVA